MRMMMHGNQWIEDKMIFASSCIEAGAKALGITPDAMYKRMKDVDLIGGYILKHYDTLHTESRKNITDDIVDCLLKWEEYKGKERAL